MLAPDFSLPRRERAGPRARRLGRTLARLWERFAPVLFCLSAAPLMAVGGWATFDWLWAHVHPAVAVVLAMIAGVDALFALAAALVLATEDRR